MYHFRSSRVSLLKKKRSAQSHLWNDLLCLLVQRASSSWQWQGLEGPYLRLLEPGSAYSWITETQRVSPRRSVPKRQKSYDSGHLWPSHAGVVDPNLGVTASCYWPVKHRLLALLAQVEWGPLRTVKMVWSQNIWETRKFPGSSSFPWLKLPLYF